MSDAYPECDAYTTHDGEHYQMPGGYGRSAADRLQHFYNRHGARHSPVSIPVGTSVSTHGRVRYHGNLMRGSPKVVKINGKNYSKVNLVLRAWMITPRTTDLKYELWSKIH